MTNNTIKNRIRKCLLNDTREGVDVDRIRFEGVVRHESGMIVINKVTLSLNSIDGVLIDEIKNALVEFEMNNNINLTNICLEI